MFLTKVWGWGAPIGPLQFSTSGWRENALRQLEPGDRVVLVGTVGEQTPDEMKGRLLGVMEPSREPVMSLDFALPTRPDDFIDGEYKWPFGLLNLQAWTLPQRPKLTDLTDRTFSMDSAQGIVPLTDEEAKRIEALDWHEEELLQPSAQAQDRLARKHGRAKQASPPPSTTKRAGVMHMRRAPAYTYAMRLVGARRSAFKIGWAFDFKQRAQLFNQASMPLLGGIKYEPFLTQLSDTARMAYAMEQALLRHFAEKRHSHNHEILTGLSDAELQAAWAAAVQRKL